MATHLVIVESPAKAKTIKKYLGKDYQVLASYGHVRDLVPKEGSVDPDNNFAMKYQTIDKNAKHVDAIAKALKKADSLLLATDQDREGEAISWHLAELMKDKNILGDKPVKRVVFNEITKTAIKNAVDHPRDISQELVDAQVARRALDYLFGFNLSPLLWKKIRPGLSAGRVQSPALGMICQREAEIEAFEPKEYWTLVADTEAEQQAFSGKLVEFNGEKVEQFTINNEKDATQTQKALLKAGNGKLIVSKVEKKQRKRNPAPPFITSTLQQEAARKLGFTASRTMQVAQQLYEGIDIGEGAIGLITYMRTDSVNLANEALDEIRSFITERYEKGDCPDEPRVFKTKAKNAQEAHEAIRPTSVRRVPDEIKSKLTTEQYKLYDLIWKRAMASQMIHATIDTVGIDLTCGQGNRFRANGSTVKNPGFIKVYQEGVDDAKQDDSDGKMLPPLKEGQELPLNEIHCNQHFTEPPPRYTEASLVKALEEYGIGRPSTYASIIYVLKNREYVTLENKRFQPTDVGRIVNKFLTEYFNDYVEYNFTAGMEDTLDAISRGESDWIPMLESFWQPFINLVGKIDESVKRSDVTHEEIDEKCPECGNQLSIRLGKRGRFIGCNGYPDCSYTRNLETGEETSKPEVIEDRACPECESELIIRHGRYGKFIGCSGYPKCRYIEPLEKPKDTGVKCPQCNDGDMVQRRSKRGKIFFSCARYPDCTYAVWNQPLDASCPQCKWKITTVKTTKSKGTQQVCPQKDCDFEQSYESDEETAND